MASKMRGGGDVAIVEPHAFGNFDFIRDGLFLLHGDHTDVFHSLGTGVDDFDVATGGPA